jgi:hypothetical protein
MCSTDVGWEPLSLAVDRLMQNLVADAPVRATGMVCSEASAYAPASMPFASGAIVLVDVHAAASRRERRSSGVTAPFESR